MGKNARSSESLFSGRYKLFKRQPDGSLVFVGDVDYSYPLQNGNDADDMSERAWELAARTADDLARLESDREAFEDLADNANEWEG